MCQPRVTGLCWKLGTILTPRLSKGAGQGQGSILDAAIVDPSTTARLTSRQCNALFSCKQMT